MICNKINCNILVLQDVAAGVFFFDAQGCSLSQIVILSYDLWTVLFGLLGFCI